MHFIFAGNVKNATSDYGYTWTIIHWWFNICRLNYNWFGRQAKVCLKITLACALVSIFYVTTQSFVWSEKCQSELFFWSILSIWNSPREILKHVIEVLSVLQIVIISFIVLNWNIFLVSEFKLLSKTWLFKLSEKRILIICIFKIYINVIIWIWILNIHITDKKIFTVTEGIILCSIITIFLI